jgi:hypothetical protein
MQCRVCVEYHTLHVSHAWAEWMCRARIRVFLGDTARPKAGASPFYKAIMSQLYDNPFCALIFCGYIQVRRLADHSCKVQVATPQTPNFALHLDP